MEIKKLQEGFKYPKCENCKKDCQGHLDYDNLCSNINYLKEYGEKNYKKNKESFIELKKIIGKIKPNIFSFGCGLGLDYVGAKEVFDGLNYYGIEECDWSIKKTDNYKNFEFKLPKTFKFDDGMFMLTAIKDNAVLCFFNSLFTISNNTVDLKEQLISALQNKQNFYILCDYTINYNYHMPKEEQDFLKSLLRKFSDSFEFKCYEILDGRGIMIAGSK